MSYILEALKKAQAERQLGNAPTIHAPPAVPVAPAAAASRRPLAIGLGVGAVVVVTGALLLWRQSPSQPSSQPPPAAPPAAPAAAPQVAAKAPPPVAAVPDTLVVTAPPAAPVHAPAPAPAPAPASAPASAPVVTSVVTPIVTSVVKPVAAPTRAAVAASAPAVRGAATAPAAVPPATAVVSAPAPEDSLPYLQQLPPAQQSGIPRVNFGGYMYSANPSDRLLIVDKALRHEGEEVAPGLVLEKLLPKAAVMNYRGTRYRVAY